MGCDAILLDVPSWTYVPSNQIVVIGLCACVVEKDVDQGEIVFRRRS